MESEQGMTLRGAFNALVETKAGLDSEIAVWCYACETAHPVTDVTYTLSDNIVTVHCEDVGGPMHKEPVDDSLPAEAQPVVMGDDARFGLELHKDRAVLVVMPNGPGGEGEAKFSMPLEGVASLGELASRAITTSSPDSLMALLMRLTGQ